MLQGKQRRCDSRTRTWGGWVDLPSAVGCVASSDGFRGGCCGSMLFLSVCCAWCGWCGRGVVVGVGGWVGGCMKTLARFLLFPRSTMTLAAFFVPQQQHWQQQPAKQRHIPSRCMLPPWSLPQLLVLVPTFRNRKALLMSRRFGVGEVWTVLTLHPGNQIQELSA